MRVDTEIRERTEKGGLTISNRNGRAIGEIRKRGEGVRGKKGKEPQMTTTRLRPSFGAKA